MPHGRNAGTPAGSRLPGDWGDQIVAKSSASRMPRVRTVTADDVDEAIERLESIQGELGAVAARMRHLKLKILTITGWGKFDRAYDLLRQFTAHSEFAVKTTPAARD